MKKVLLFAIALLALGLVSDATAGCWRNRCRTACEPACEPRCETKCCVQSYNVVEDKCPSVPRCVKYVPVEGTPICYRTCRWACPAGYELQGYKEAHTFTLQGKSEFTQ